MKYVIIWAEGKLFYTHSDESSQPILFTLEELTRANTTFWHRAPGAWPAESDGQVAIPLDALNVLLGVE